MFPAQPLGNCLARRLGPPAVAARERPETRRRGEQQSLPKLGVLVYSGFLQPFLGGPQWPQKSNRSLAFTLRGGAIAVPEKSPAKLITFRRLVRFSPAI